MDTKKIKKALGYIRASKTILIALADNHTNDAAYEGSQCVGLLRTAESIINLELDIDSAKTDLQKGMAALTKTDPAPIYQLSEDELEFLKDVVTKVITGDMTKEDADKMWSMLHNAKLVSQG